MAQIGGWTHYAIGSILGWIQNAIIQQHIEQYMYVDRSKANFQNNKTIVDYRNENHRFRVEITL